MKIVTWNVNSIKVRTPHVQRFLERVQPDILCLQELKCLEFPAESFAGYRAHALGQKAYNVVAFLSKFPFEVAHPRLVGDDSDEHARYMEIDVEGIRVINPSESEELENFTRRFHSLRREKGIKEAEAREAVHQPNYFGAMMVAMHQADGLISGVSHITGSVLRVCGGALVGA